MDAIRCQGLSRSYGSVQALISLDLAVPEGSVFGFLGRNGAGKTTTIRLLTGLARPSSGDAWICDVKTTNGIDSARAKFGYLPEEPAFYGWLTPEELLDYIGTLFYMTKEERKRRIDELLVLTDLDGDRQRRISGFSRGMRQRLGIAQALMHNPPVLFLDEPTSALDPAGRHDVLRLIDGLRDQTTIFLSSHILSDVERVCDTVGVIHEGELLLVAGRDELLSRYAANIVLLEFELDALPLSHDFLSELEQLPWVGNIEVESGNVRLAVDDVDQGKQNLLPLILRHGLTLNKYEWLRPTLEEVFLTLSS